MKKKFVAVIGPGASGKSSIVSSLSGCRSSSYSGFIVERSTGNSVYVCCGSPQEMPAATLPKIKTWMSLSLKKALCRGMVMAMQPTKPRTRVSMDDIIKTALQLGFDVRAFVLEPGYSKPNLGIYQRVKNDLENLGVPSLQILPLNAKQYAIKSANIINATTSLFN